MDADTLLTVKEAAEHIGVSESAVRNATLEGRLPFVRMYGRKLIKVADLTAYQERAHPGGIKPKGRPPKDAEAAETVDVTGDTR
jgi:excisionase family DNA binding protein